MPSLRTHGFFPHWFQREAVPTYELSASEQLVFYAVCGQANNDGVAKASQRLLEERTGLSRSSVKRSLARLLQLYLLERTWPAGVKTAAQYRVPELMPLPAPKLALPTRTDAAQVRSQRTA